MQGGGGAPAADADQAQFEADKRAVYKHPLFPLLALLLERCEQATAGAEPLAADAFGADLQAFVQHQRRDRRPFLVDDPEIDGLMIKSIQVLRIHLLELEKVQELCRDFCGRYIACLKTKMQSENLLRTDYTAGGVESNNNLSGSMDDHSSTSNSPQYQSPPAPLPAPPFPAAFPAHADLPYSASHRDPTSLVVHGSTPISQIGAGLISTDSFTGTNSNNSCSSVSGSPPPEEECEDSSGKRGVLPRHATQVMRAWLFQHLVVSPVPHGGGEAHPGGADAAHPPAGEQLVHKREAPHPAAHAGLRRQARWQKKQKRLVHKQEVLARRTFQPPVHGRALVLFGRRGPGGGAIWRRARATNGGGGTIKRARDLPSNTTEYALRFRV